MVASLECRGPEVAVERERRVFGRHNIAEVVVRDLVCLPQVRKEQNSEYGELKESIRKQNLMHPISVARLSLEQLEKYIDFVNEIWQTTVPISDFWDQRQEVQDDNGEVKEIWFNVVVAGHSRTKALLEIEAEDNAETGAPYDGVTDVHVLDITEPEDIISYQISENIHSKPSQERRAMGIAKMYHRGLERGEWSSPAAFSAKTEGKFSAHLVREALGFANLPSEARSYIFSGQLPYSVGVEIGLGSGTLMEYSTKKVREDKQVQDPTPQHFDNAYRTEVAVLIMEVLNQRMKIGRARTHIKASIDEKKKILHPDGSTPKALFSMEDLEKSYTEELEKKYQRAVSKMADLSPDAVIPVIKLAEQLRNGEAGKYKEEYDERKERFSMILGELAVNEVAQAA